MKITLVGINMKNKNVKKYDAMHFYRKQPGMKASRYGCGYPVVGFLKKFVNFALKIIG